MTVEEFENAVWALEGVRIVIRARQHDEVDDYDYERAAQDSWRINQLINGRIVPRIGNHEVIVLEGDGEQPHGSVILRTIRTSYHNH